MVKTAEYSRPGSLLGIFNDTLVNSVVFDVKKPNAFRCLLDLLCELSARFWSIVNSTNVNYGNLIWE